MKHIIMVVLILWMSAAVAAGCACVKPEMKDHDQPAGSDGGLIMYDSSGSEIFRR